MRINFGKVKLKKRINFGKVKLGIKKVYPELEDLEITPSGEEQIFKSTKYGYKNVKVRAVESEELDITPSTEKQVREGMYKKVTVTGDSDLIPNNIRKDTIIYGITGIMEESWDTSLIINCKEMFVNNANIIEAPLFDTQNVVSMYDMFNGCVNLITVPKYNTSKVTSMSGMFGLCEKIKTVPNFDTSKVTSMQRMFYGCKEMITVPYFDTSKVTSMERMFYGCKEMITVPNFDTSKVTNFGDMFTSCRKMITAPNFDTSNATCMEYFFRDCTQLVNIPEYNAEKVNMIFRFLTESYELKNMGGLVNLGKAYTSKRANDSYYTLDVHYCNKLTHDSLMNIINKLYDLNLTYNVANGGTLYTQQLVIGATNMAKLTSEEIAIATNKGWTVS